MTGRLLQSILKLFLKRKGLLYITLRDGSSEAFETWFTRILSVTKKKLLNEEKSLTDIQYSTASVKLQGGNAQTSKEVKLSSIVVLTSAYSANVYGKVIIIALHVPNAIRPFFKQQIDVRESTLRHPRKLN